MKSGTKVAGSELLHSLEKDAKAKGFLLIAHRAETALDSGIASKAQ